MHNRPSYFLRAWPYAPQISVKEEINCINCLFSYKCHFIRITNKTECFSFKSGHVIWVKKHLNENWIIVLH